MRVYLGFITFLFLASTQLTTASTGKGSGSPAPDSSCSLSFKRMIPFGEKKAGVPDPTSIFCSATFVQPGLFATADHCIDGINDRAVIASCGCEKSKCKFHIELGKAMRAKQLKNHPGDTGYFLAKEKPKGLEPMPVADVKDYLSKDGKKVLDDVECYGSGYGVSRESIFEPGVWHPSKMFEVRPFYSDSIFPGEKKRRLVSKGPSMYVDVIERSRQIFLGTVEQLPKKSVEQNKELNKLVQHARAADKNAPNFSYSVFDDYSKLYAPLVYDISMDDELYNHSSLQSFVTRADSGGGLFCKKSSEKVWKFVGIQSSVHVGEGHPNDGNLHYYTIFEPYPIAPKPTTREQAISNAHRIWDQQKKSKRLKK